MEEEVSLFQANSNSSSNNSRSRRRKTRRRDRSSKSRSSRSRKWRECGQTIRVRSSMCKCASCKRITRRKEEEVERSEKEELELIDA